MEISIYGVSGGLSSFSCQIESVTYLARASWASSHEDHYLSYFCPSKCVLKWPRNWREHLRALLCNEFTFWLTEWPPSIGHSFATWSWPSLCCWVLNAEVKRKILEWHFIRISTQVQISGDREKWLKSQFWAADRVLPFLSFFLHRRPFSLLKAPTTDVLRIKEKNDRFLRKRSEDDARRSLRRWKSDN